MPNVQFTSVILQSLSRTRKGGKATFSASLTPSVCKALDWTEDIPECLTNASPEGALAASSVELTPSQSDLTKLSVSLGVAQINGFEIVRRELEGNRGKGHRLELRFHVSFADGNGCARLEQYMQAVGENKGKLAVGYTKQPQQERLISEEQAEDTTKED